MWETRRSAKMMIFALKTRSFVSESHKNEDFCLSKSHKTRNVALKMMNSAELREQVILMRNVDFPLRIRGFRLSDREFLIQKC